MKKNNFSIYRNNYFKKANNFLPNSYFNNSENDSSLQNRIERSLYPSNKRSQPYRTNTIHNISDYDYNNNSNNDLIEDFKTTIILIKAINLVLILIIILIIKITI